MEESAEHLEASRPPIDETTDGPDDGAGRHSSRRWWALLALFLVVGALAGMVWWKSQSAKAPVSVPLLEETRTTTAASPAERAHVPEERERDEQASSEAMSPAIQDNPVPSAVDLQQLAAAVAEALENRPLHPALRAISPRLDGIDGRLASLSQPSEGAAPFEQLHAGQAELRERIQRLSAQVAAPKPESVEMPFSVISSGRFGSVPFVLVDAGRPLQVSVGETFVGWTLETVEVASGQWVFRKGIHQRTGSTAP